MSVGNVPTVFIIDDDSGVRESIKDLVESVGLRAQSFATAQEFLSSERRDAPSCLVLDIRLPGISGLDLQHELKRVGVKIPIIFISGHADIPMTVRAMKSGAAEFLTKPFRDQDLLDVIQRALDRERVVREKQRHLAELQERYARLSVREREVMNLVVVGRLNKQIAAELKISVETVQGHVKNILAKLSVHDRTEAVAVAIRRGIVHLDRGDWAP